MRAEPIEVGRRLTGGLLVVASAVEFGLATVLGRLTIRRGVDVEAMLSFRFFMAAGVLFAILIATRQPLVAASRERFHLAWLANAGYAFESSLFFLAARHATLAFVSLLFYSYPIIVTLALWLIFRRRPSLLGVVALAVSAGGAGIVIAGSGVVNGNTAGIPLALGSAVAYSVYLLGTDVYIRATHPITAAAWVTGSAAIGVAIVATINHTWMVPSGDQWLPLVAMSITTAAAFSCLLSGLPRIGAMWTSILSTTEAVAVALLAALMLSEPFRATTAVGGALVLAGATLAAVAIRDARGQSTHTTASLPSDSSSVQDSRGRRRESGRS